MQTVWTKCRAQSRFKLFATLMIHVVLKEFFQNVALEKISMQNYPAGNDVVYLPYYPITADTNATMYPETIVLMPRIDVCFFCSLAAL